MDASQHIRYNKTLTAIAALYASRLLLYCPAVASSYVAIFNGLRRTTYLIHVNDFLACFGCPDMWRAAALGSIFFTLNILFLSPFTLNIFAFFPPIPFILYGVYSTYTCFVMPYYLENPNAGIMEAFAVSVATVHRFKWQMLLFCFNLSVIQWSGVMLFFVGAYLTIPVTFLAVCMAYHHLIGVKGFASYHYS